MVDETKLKIFSQNIRGLGNKMDELLLYGVNDFPHVICLSEHHLTSEAIRSVTIDNYNLGAFYSRKIAKCGGVCILLHKSCQFTSIDLSHYCSEKNIEICAIKLNNKFLNVYVLSLYRSPIGDFNIFLEKLEEILNLLIADPINIIICGDFNVNFMLDSTDKHQLISLLKIYNLDYIVTFPTRINETTQTSIDNIFLDKSKYTSYVIEPYFNGLSDHDALMLTMNVTLQKMDKITKSVRIYDDCFVDEFILNLSYENWENVFNSQYDSDINIIFNNFLNTYLRIFHGCFPVQRIIVGNMYKGWLTKGILISSEHKKSLYLLCRSSKNPVLKNHYRKYCKILTNTIQMGRDYTIMN